MFGKILVFHFLCPEKLTFGQGGFEPRTSRYEVERTTTGPTCPASLQYNYTLKIHLFKMNSKTDGTVTPMLPIIDKDNFKKTFCFKIVDVLKTLRYVWE